MWGKGNYFDFAIFALEVAFVKINDLKVHLKSEPD